MGLLPRHALQRFLPAIDLTAFFPAVLLQLAHHRRLVCVDNAGEFVLARSGVLLCLYQFLRLQFAADFKPYEDFLDANSVVRVALLSESVFPMEYIA